jgi:Holliday junction resolvasome RuvABC endonuclease subunit
MPNTPTRIFALDPIHKGFGYAVLDLPFRLVDWGLARIAGDKHAGAIASFEKLLDRFRPDAVVLEDTAAPGSRRQPRIRRLIEALSKLARERGIAVFTVARTAILKCFSSADAKATKQSIATQLAEGFPQLRPKLPPARALWESEDERLSIFDALALAVTHAKA